MRIKRISETVQEFGGERYYLCSSYFQRRGKRLHRAVWEHYRGKIPRGHHVHHHDGDPSNNRLGNLRLLTPAEHRAVHGATNPDGPTPEAREAAAAWHGSDEGRLWHAEQHRKHCAPSLRRKERRRCEFCGVSFWCRAVGRAKFCSEKCRAGARRDSGVDDEERRCEICGVSFTIRRYLRTRTCSRICGRQLR